MSVALDIAVTGVSVVIVGAYIWSLRGHFVSETVPAGTRVIAATVGLSAALLLYLTWANIQPIWAQVLGLCLQLASGALFVAAIRASRRARLRYAFDPEHPHSLLEDGPYRVIRHPFYTSYVIFWAGWAIAAWSPSGFACFLVLLAIYIWAARMEERNFAASPLAADYAAYKGRTGFFWPRIG